MTQQDANSEWFKQWLELAKQNYHSHPTHKWFLVNINGILEWQYLPLK
jgi:hypothetical protein